MELCPRCRTVPIGTAKEVKRNINNVSTYLNQEEICEMLVY